MFLKRVEELYQLIRLCEYTTDTGSIDRQQALVLAHAHLEATKKKQGIVYVIGNGGSSGIASHFYTDLIKGLEIPAATLVDSNLLTCIGNDLGYENVFSHPLQTLLQPQDLLVAISSSGRSENILNAVEVAKEKRATVITLSGFLQNNPLRTKGDLNFWLGACDYGLVEIGHSSLLHTIIDTWKDRKTLSQMMMAYVN